MDPVILHTARLTLSVPTAADAEAIFEACQDAAIQRYTTVPSPYERQDAADFITSAHTRWAKGVEATWALREGDTLAGIVGLHRITPGGSGELGYWMAPSARGRGLLTEACRAVLDWGFDTAGAALHRIEWRAVVGNVGSARVARALGFRYEGVLRGALANSFGRDDAWVAGLLPGDERTAQAWSVLAD